MDFSDLYDHEIKQVNVIWKKLMSDWSRKPNTKANLQEFAKVATDEFMKAGFVVNVMWENTLVINPATMQPYPITLEILGRAPGVDRRSVNEDGFTLMDHEFKRHEVLQSKERGEDYHGQKGKASA